MSYSQDKTKVSKIGKILCDCFEVNALKNNFERIEDCGYVLTKGLSVIKSDSIKNIYAQSADTYLQKNCLEYIKLMAFENPTSDVTVIEVNEYHSLKKEAIPLSNKITGKKYFYQDLIGDTILVNFIDNKLIEINTNSNTKTFFSIKKNQPSNKLIFDHSQNPFLEDYFKKGEIIDFFILSQNYNSSTLFLKYSNNITIKKELNIKR